MKVSRLKEILSEMQNDDDVFVLLYEKSMFDFDSTDEVWLSPENWAKLVGELEEVPFESLWSDICDAVNEYAEPNPKWEGAQA